MSTPEHPTWSSGWRTLACACAAYLLLFAWSYPPTHAIEDEVGFINQTLVWSHVTLDAAELGWPAMADFTDVDGRRVGWRNPARSLIALPFLLVGGLDAVFWSGALIHLGVVLLGALCLVHAGRSPAWAVLILTHPTLALYSRTVMADELGGLFLLLALYAAIRGKRPGAWGGLAVGLGAAARYHLAVALPALAASLWLRRDLARPRREALLCLATGAAIGAILVGYNIVALGAPLGPTFQGYFDLRFVPRNALHYGLALLLLWPGMLTGVALARSPWAGSARALTLPVLILLLGDYWFDARPSRLETLVLGQRLAQPALPCLIVLFAVGLEQRFGAAIRARVSPGLARLCGPLGTAGLCVGLGLLFARHHDYLANMVRARDALTTTIPDGATVVVANRTLAKLLEVPHPDRPSYRWVVLSGRGDLGEDPVGAAAERTWYVAHLGKHNAEEPERLRALRSRWGAIPLPTPSSGLHLYRVPGATGASNKRAEGAAMNVRRALRAPRHVRRLPEVLRCIARTSDWARFLAGYLGVAAPAYPFDLVLRSGDRLRIDDFGDLVTAWVVLVREDYHLPNKPRVILDVGANIGSFSLLAARRAPQAQIVALEPFPATFARLQETVTRNGLEQRITCYPWALAGDVGERRMQADPALPSHKRALLRDQGGRAAIDVECLTLEALLEREGIAEVDLLKLDIEGTEHELLDATSDSVLQRIHAVALEYHPERPKEELFARLVHSGLRLVQDQSAGRDSGVAHFVR